MEFRIEKKERFNIVGVLKRVPLEPEAVTNVVAELAKSITEQQRNEMSQLADLYPHQMLQGAFYVEEENSDEKDSFTHMMGFATTKENPFDDLEQITVNESLWAIFPNEGPFPATLQETNAKIYSERLPSSDYEVVELPGITFTKRNGTLENVYSEIWVPVMKKVINR